MPSLDDQISGGLIGLLVGDALGVPYEFHTPSAIPPLGEIVGAGPAGDAGLGLHPKRRLKVGMPEIRALEEDGRHAVRRAAVGKAIPEI